MDGFLTFCESNTFSPASPLHGLVVLCLVLHFLSFVLILKFIFSFPQVCARTARLLPVRADGNKAAHAENRLRLDVGGVPGAVLPA
jgi:hypothetical protein